VNAPAALTAQFILLQVVQVILLRLASDMTIRRSEKKGGLTDGSVAAKEST
jgi:hypothetical protein